MRKLPRPDCALSPFFHALSSIKRRTLEADFPSKFFASDFPTLFVKFFFFSDMRGTSV